MSFSDVYENSILDHLLGTTVLTAPANLYLALSTADPLDDGSGIAEPVGNSYARVAVPAWNVAASRQVKNNGAFNFPQATGAWGTITHWALFDALTAGTFVGSGLLNTSRVIVSGNTAQIADLEIVLEFLTGGITTFAADEMLDHVVGAGLRDYTPAGHFVGLATAALGDGGAFTNEVSGNAYARVSQTLWNAAAAGAADNNGIITFPSPTGPWGTITDGFLADALTAGNMLIYAPLSVQTNAPDNGDTVRFPSGDFNLTLS